MSIDILLSQMGVELCTGYPKGIGAVGEAGAQTV